MSSFCQRLSAILSSPVGDSHLLRNIWQQSITGKILFKSADNDLRVVKINAEAERICLYQLKVGSLLAATMEGHKEPIHPYGIPLIELYRGCLSSGAARHLEFRYSYAPHGWFAVDCVPIKGDYLLLDFADITALKEAAYVDDLTGLYNRRYLSEIDQLGWGGCLFLDLDRFKLVNDARGHLVGDRILWAVAALVRMAATEVNGVALRFGGDEFLLLLDEECKLRAITVAAGLLGQIKALRVDGTSISVSIGVVTAGGKGWSLSELQQAAELACREAKTDKRSDDPISRIKKWDAALAAKHRRQVQIEAYLNLAEAEFSLVYQPVYRLDTGRMVSAEALIRWQSPDLGMVRPDEFIPIAEMTGQIFKISDWVIATGLEQLAEWVQLWPDFALAFNISPGELENLKFTRWLQSRIEEAGLSAENVELEVTERGISRNLEHYLHVLSELRAARVRLKLDDFGVGHSGLLMLLQSPFYAVKVDRMLLPANREDNERMSICSAIASMSMFLNFALVAEGIETAEQLEILRGMSYEFGQGYYLGRPVEANLITTMLESPLGR